MKHLISLLTLVFSVAVAAETQIPSIDWVPRSDWINVRDDGATGDGETDDTAALQKAFDRLANDVTIYLPPGRYVVSDTLFWRSSDGERLTGTSIIGHGRDTVLVWKGGGEKPLVEDQGLSLSRFVGLSFEGGGEASIGIRHFNRSFFETNVRKSFLAFKGFTTAGVLMVEDSLDGGATAEIVFENCVFDDTGRAVSFTSFNDYNYSFERCLFRNNDVGVYGFRCNFMVRECRFESNGIDIETVPEHMSSVRRSVSVGSGQFLKFENRVSPMVVEGCVVSGWTSTEGAVVSRGAPLIVFDTVFEGSSASAPIQAAAEQEVIVSRNQPEDLSRLFRKRPKSVTVVPRGSVDRVEITADTRFLAGSYPTPSRVHDAVRDFGAAGDGRADDTAAVRGAIAAAKRSGGGAVAYLPAGTYRVTDTIELSGGDYVFGGAGIGSEIVYDGDPARNVVEIRDANHLVLRNLGVQSKISRDAGDVPSEADIAQFGSDGPSLVTYDGVYVFGKYAGRDAKQPRRQGLRFVGLNAGDRVHLRHVEGNLQFLDSAPATVLGNNTYEGTLIVEGERRAGGGFLGFLTRLSTISNPCVIVNDNQSLVISDMYIEQCRGEAYVFGGSRDLEPGRVTLGMTKIQRHTGNAEGPLVLVDLGDYHGRVGSIAGQFYSSKLGMQVVASPAGDATLDLVGVSVYKMRVETPSGTPRPLLRSVALGITDGDVTASPGAISDLGEVADYLDDLRRLGRLDLEFNHPALVGGTRPGR